MKLPGRLGRSLAALGLACLTMTGMVAISSPSALAAGPASVSNLHPNDTLANDKVLSDRTDGVDQKAHVTTVASVGTAAVEWFACPDSYAGTDPTATGSGCESQGVDSNPKTPAAGTPGAGTNSAFELFYDIPTSLDGHTVAWVAWACTSATTRTAANCTQDADHGIFLEDAAGGTAGQTTAGEITSIQNGAVIPGDKDIKVTASTSDDVTSLQFCIADPTGAASGAHACTVSHTAASPDSTGLNSKTWSATFTAAEVPDNSGFVFAITNTAGGTAQCDASSAAKQCRLDEHYVVSTLNANGTKAQLSFPTQTTPRKEACGTSTNNTATNASGSTEEVDGCILNSTGTPVTNSVDWVMTVTPQDQSAACFSGEGTETGVNNTPPATDNCAETVVGDPGDATGGGQGATTVDQSLTLKKTGTYTVTFCLDTNNNGVCDSGEPSATGTKTVTAGAAAQDRTRFAADAPVGSQCTTGQTQQSFPANATVDVKECVFDANNNPVANQSGILWFINGPGDFKATSATTDTNGQAVATVEKGVAGQQTQVSSCVDTNGDGVCNVPGNEVIISWTQPPAGPDSLTLRAGSKSRTGPKQGMISFTGELKGVGDPCLGNEGGALIQIHRGRSDGPVLVSATTDPGGRYQTSRTLLHLGKKHVRHFVATTDGNVNCVAAVSNNLKVRGFR